MRNLRLYILTLFLLVPALGACDGMFDLDINEDPNAATAVQGDLLLPTVLARVGAVRSIEIGPGNAFFAQIWAPNGSTGVFIDPDRYDISSFTVGNAWSIFYAGSMNNLVLIRDQALAADPAQPNAAAQAEIMMAYIFWMLTASWGDIPFTQALDGAQFPNPEFDDQETVLRGIVDMLDVAVGRIDTATTAMPGIGFGDLVYGGNMANWERFANSLKLRTLMMIRNRDAGVDAQIQALLNQPLVRTNAQEAAIPFFTTTANENNVWRLNNMFGGFSNAGNGNVYLFAGEPLVDLMKQLGDPRLGTYFALATDFDTGDVVQTEYFGQRAGVSDWGDNQTSMVSQNIIRRDWPERMVTAAEVHLLEAEFRARTGDLPGAHAAYMAGVQAGLDYFNDKPGAITDGAKATYLAALPQSFTSQPLAIEAILQQQYIEVFDRAPENWAQWKRTHYPALAVPEQAVLGTIIRRYPYPPAELSANPNAPPQQALDLPMWYEPVN